MVQAWSCSKSLCMDSVDCLPGNWYFCAWGLCICWATNQMFPPLPLRIWYFFHTSDLLKFTHHAPLFSTPLYLFIFSCFPCIAHFASFSFSPHYFSLKGGGAYFLINEALSLSSRSNNIGIKFLISVEKNSSLSPKAIITIERETEQEEPDKERAEETETEEVHIVEPGRITFFVLRSRFFLRKML